MQGYYFARDFSLTKTMVQIALFFQLVFLPFMPAKPSEGIATITFDQHTIKLGTIYPEERYERIFTFTNTGDAPLIISDIETSCGCTVVKFSKEPVMPGKTGEVKVDYIPKKNTLGFISKSFVVTTNAKNNPEYLYLHGTVVKKGKKKK